MNLYKPGSILVMSIKIFVESAVLSRTSRLSLFTVRLSLTICNEHSRKNLGIEYKSGQFHF